MEGLRSQGLGLKFRHKGVSIGFCKASVRMSYMGSTRGLSSRDP